MTEPQPETRYVQSDCRSIAGMKRFSHEAMATTFEVIVVHEDVRYARQAAAAAFAEVDRLEADLSRYIENSDISRINNLPANQPLLIGLAAFECLQLSCRMYSETGGAFDITIGSLLDCWRNEDGTPRTPSQQELNLARQRTGTALLKLDEAEHTVELLASPMQVDLGGIGKGFAVDLMAELLRDWSIDTALISGGYSSVLALDAPAGTKGWPLTLSDPANRRKILARPYLKRHALSGSGLQKGGHIIDPRTARPVKGKRAAWACAPDAATADALSTAFMVMTPDEIKKYCLRHPDVLAMIILEDGGKDAQKGKILRFGPWE
ncbi:MAG: FAD:protein FMN transferase [Planctomycetota bacterium]|jgi:thiamine biosynthesis lipoprotein